MTTVYKNPWFSVIKEGKYHFVKESGAGNGAVVLAKSPFGFLFVEVSRPANKGLFIEAPRGYGENGETAKQCAARELKEETGLEVPESQLFELGTMQPNSAILASTVTVFLAKIEAINPTAETDGEVHGLVRIPENEITKAISLGRITDGFTLSALAMFWSRQ